MAEAFEAQRQAVDGLQRPLAALAEQLEAPLPALPESAAQLTSGSGISVIVPKVLLMQQEHQVRTFDVCPARQTGAPPLLGLRLQPCAW